jgi:hypothetical protein
LINSEFASEGILPPEKVTADRPILTELATPKGAKWMIIHALYEQNESSRSKYSQTIVEFSFFNEMATALPDYKERLALAPRVVAWIERAPKNRVISKLTKKPT